MIEVDDITYQDICDVNQFDGSCEEIGVYRLRDGGWDDEMVDKRWYLVDGKDIIFVFVWERFLHP